MCWPCSGGRVLWMVWALQGSAGTAEEAEERTWKEWSSVCCCKCAVCCAWVHFSVLCTASCTITCMYVRMYNCYVYVSMSASVAPVQAKSDKITALEKYRERSQPCFQFLAVSLAVLWGAVVL